MPYGTEDWLEVVYATGLETVRGWRPGGRTEIRIREAPALESLPPWGEHRLRVTVSPSDPRLEWRLYLMDARSGDEPPRDDRVWWRSYPGTWQPLARRQCVAEGRGRVRVNLSIRMDADGAEDPQLRLVAEST